MRSDIVLFLTCVCAVKKNKKTKKKPLWFIKEKVIPRASPAWKQQVHHMLKLE